MLPWVRLAVRFPRTVLAAAALVTLVLGWQIPSLVVRTDGAALRGEQGTVSRLSRVDEEVFAGSEDVIVVLGAGASGGTVASPAGLRALAALDAELRAVPGVRAGGVRSLASLRELRVSASTLATGRVLEAIPDEPAAFAALLARARTKSFVDGTLLASSGATAALYVPLVVGTDRTAALAGIEALAERWRARGFTVELTGPVVAQALLGRAVLTDLGRLIPFMVLLISALLLYLLRTPAGLLFPMLEVLLVLVWTFGTMAWLGVPLTLVTTSLPVVLMATSITDEIHLMERLQQLLARPGATALEAVLGTYEELERPILTTWLTTCAGMAAFLASPLLALRHFGLLAGLGILYALFVSFTVIPAAVVLAPVRWSRRRALPTAELRVSGFERSLLAQPRRWSFALLLGLAALAPGLAGLRVEDNWIANFPASSPLVAAERTYNRDFWGSYRFDVVLEADDDRFYRPEGAAAVAEVAAGLAGREGVGGVASYLLPLGDLAAALGKVGAVEAQPLADLEELLTLARSAEDANLLSEWLTVEGDRARVRLFLKSESFARDQRLAAEVATTVGAIAHRHGLRYHTSGDVPLGLEMVGSIVASELGSIFVSVLVILVTVAFFYRRPLEILAVFLPVAIAGFVVFAVMGWSGIALGIATSMFGSLAIGTGVDFALHLLEAFKKALAAGREGRDAVLAALAEAGPSVRWNALVLVLGFAVLMASSVRPNLQLGVVLCLALAAAYLATVVLFCTLGPRLAWRRAGAASRLGAPAAVSFGGLVLVALGLAACGTAERPAAPPPHAEPPAVLGRPDASAEAWMREVEAEQRAGMRLVRIDAETQRAAERVQVGYPAYEEAQLWGLVDGRSERQRQLFLFCEPRRMRGTGLVLEDQAGELARDEMAFHMKTWDHFKGIPRTSLRLLVPGTCLTYEDARGFLSTDHYAFAWAPEAPEGRSEPGRKRVIGWPRDPSLAADIGYDWFVATLDEGKKAVLRIEYHAANGEQLKIYDVRSLVQVGRLWTAAEARLEDRQNQVTSDLRFTFWQPAGPIPEAVFERPVTAEPLLERIRKTLLALGVAEATQLEACGRVLPTPKEETHGAAI
jgi:uncharacterized protein